MEDQRVKVLRDIELMNGLYSEVLQYLCHRQLTKWDAQSPPHGLGSISERNVDPDSSHYGLALGCGSMMERGWCDRL
jgi:hypothetical protein